MAIDERDLQRRRVDEMVRPSSSLNWIYGLALLLALAFGAWFLYGGSLNGIGSPTSTSTITQPAPAPYPVNPTPPSPSATTTPPQTPPVTNP